MQAVLVLPSIGDAESPAAWYDRLCQKVSGVPLVIRVLATAARSGVTSILVVRTSATPAWWIRKRLQSPLISGLPMQIVGIEPTFDANDAASWSLLAPMLEPTFLWLPWNYVTLRRPLALLIASERTAPGTSHVLHRPAVVATDTLLATHGGRLDEYVLDPSRARAEVREPAGVAVWSWTSRRDAERLLVRGSGKLSDGIYTNFNRRLCRPAVRCLANTPVTANAITIVGLLVTILSTFWYAQGSGSAYVFGAVLSFASMLLDEVDGMLARTKFQESSFGTRLGALTGHASYLFPLAGVSIGLSRQFRTPIWLALGALTMTISVLRFGDLFRRRRIAISSTRPEECDDRFIGSLAADATTP